MVKLSITLGLLTALVASACGSSGDSSFPEGSSGNGTSGGASGTSGGSLGGDGGPGSSSGDPDPNAADAAGCVGKPANTDRKPATLFFILDQSGSMTFPECAFTNSACFGGGGGAKPACCTESEKPKRWTPITTALKAFVQDPQSKGITAGLELFPHGASTSDFSSPSPSCDVSKYAADITKMDVGLVPLPDPGGTSFSSKLPDTPQFIGTPTKFVFQSIGPIAKKYAQEHPEGKTAIVLLTDGLPEVCSAEDNKIANVAAEVAKYADIVPTYVIGVSALKTNLANLKDIAIAGGTGDATIVDTSSPETTQKTFLDRINTIRDATLSCDVAIPPAPVGVTRDLAKVNVKYTPKGAATTALLHDDACKDVGWKFDSPTAPTKIVLCPKTCNTYKADPDASVVVEFGCSTVSVSVQ